MNKSIIEYDDFDKVEILTGTIMEATENVKARNPAYILKIDFGEKVGIKFSSAQITNYSIKELINTNKDLLVKNRIEKFSNMGVVNE